MSTVTIFEHSNFKGKCQNLGPGSYNKDDLKIGNDKLSSIQVPAGWKVRLYQHSNFRGQVKTVINDTAALYDFNDQTSSMVVIAPANEAVATVFEHSGYRGKEQHLSPGRYNIGDLTIGNDRLSSLKVPQGLRVTLFEHSNFRGDRRTYTEDIPALSNFNDKTSSIAVDEAVADPGRTSLNQFAFVPGTNDYRFGFNSIPNMVLRGFPANTDYSRWAMLHDGKDYRIFFFRKGSNNTIYQGAFNQRTAAYEFAYRSLPQIIIQGIPGDADTSNFAMLHDGSVYRLYLKKKNKPTELLQFGYNPAIRTFVFGYRSIPRIQLINVPADINWNGWGMLHDGDYYRLYNWKRGGTQFYQAAFNGVEYQFGFKSIPLLDLVGNPPNSDITDFAMVHDRRYYRFYLQTR